jgi:prepilin-type N-terminal cleavage/methylation domain-containing protein
MKRYSGFTLIELVVVIAILAILASFALPRFASLSDSAHSSSVEAAGGSLAASVSLVRSQWLANGTHTALTNLPGFGEPNNVVDVSVDGWPTGVNGNTDPGGMSAGECNALWDALMNTNGLSASTSVGEDYLTTVNSGDCRYTYQATADGFNIEYDPNSGNVYTEINP